MVRDGMVGLGDLEGVQTEENSEAEITGVRKTMAHSGIRK